MNYCILRAAKLSTMQSIRGSAGHTFRELPTPNADPKRTHLNVTVGANGRDEVCEAIKAKLPAKRRKDAVLCIEYLITASPEWLQVASDAAKKKYFNDACRWLYARHGKENVVCLNLQRDETSDHLVAYVVPLTSDGRLSAKDFLGGPNLLRQMQDDFAEKVGKPSKLQRGIEGSKAIHTTNKQYNAMLKKAPQLMPPPAPTITMQDRLTGKAKEKVAHHEKEMMRYTREVEQARNVALVGMKSRAAQARAIESIRKKMAQLEADQKKAEQEKQEATARAECLERENKRLMQRIDEREEAFANEKRSLLDVIANLKDQLQTALRKVERLVARVLHLEDMLFPQDEIENIIRPK
jgi:hypothetical protein